MKPQLQLKRVTLIQADLLLLMEEGVDVVVEDPVVRNLLTQSKPLLVPPIADGSGRGRGRHSNSTSSSSPNNNSSSSTPRYPGPYRNHQDRSYFSYLACQQIDQIFNPDSLCIDTFIRSYMDEAGYVPLSLVVTYQNVASFQCTYNDILKKMKEVVGKCKYIELDSDNETIRLKTGWEKVIDILNLTFSLKLTASLVPYA